VQRAVADRWPDAVCHPPLDDDAFAAVLAAPAPTVGPDATGEPRRPLVVVTREPEPGSPEHARLEAAWAARPDLVVVHTGLPVAVPAVAAWFARLPGGPPPVISTCGTARVNAQAAAVLLADGWAADTTPVAPT
jgi:beta-N-acetylhexosaminidase